MMFIEQQFQMTGMKKAKKHNNNIKIKQVDFKFYMMKQSNFKKKLQLKKILPKYGNEF